MCNHELGGIEISVLNHYEGERAVKVVTTIIRLQVP